MGQVIKMGSARPPLRTEQKPRIYFRGGVWRVQPKYGSRIVGTANDEALLFAIGKNEQLYEQEQKEKAGKAPE
jgi:hypothetical protein